MPSLPIRRYKEGLTYRKALRLIKELKADGFRAFYEKYGSGKGDYQVIWY